MSATAAGGDRTVAPTLVATLTGGAVRRRLIDRAMAGVAAVAALAILVPLVALVGYILVRGAPAITPEFLTRSAELYEDGGALAGILGSLQIVPLATLVAAPIGILAGIFVAELAPPPVATAVRLVADVMTGIPSIVVGVFAYLLIVVPLGGFGARAAIFALAMIMVPIVLRSTEEFLRLVPESAREAATALGFPRWRVLLTVVLRAGLGGVASGVLLAVARIAGETAPLLLTALGSQIVNVGDFAQPMDTLPTFIYHGAALPSDILVGQAWGASLVLLLFVLFVNLTVRVYAARRTVGGTA